MKDAVSSLVGACETIRQVARDLEAVELSTPQSRADLRHLMGELRYRAHTALALAALEMPGEAPTSARISTVPKAG